LGEAHLMTAGQTVIPLVFGLLFAFSAYGSIMNWKYYTSNEFGYYQYDAENVRRFSNSILRVRQKLVLSDNGTIHLVRELGKNYDDAKEIITLREIDCAGKKSRIVEVTYHSADGLVIKSESYDPVEWDVIMPDSVDDVLYHCVCE